MNENKLIVSESVHSADMLYASEFRAPDSFIYFETDKEKAIIVSSLEYNRALNEHKEAINIYCNDDFKDTAISKILIELSNKYNITNWTVPNDFPLIYADTLRESQIEVKCSKTELFPERVSKSNAEIAKIKNALKIAENAMQRAFDILSESIINQNEVIVWKDEILTSEILRAEINIEIVRQGGVAFDTIVAGGKQGAEPHNIGSGALFAMQPIVMDIFPQDLSTGYFGDLSRTVVKGKAPIRIQKAFDTVLKARDKAKELINCDMLASDAHKIAFEIIEKAGFPTGKRDGKQHGFMHGLGHGVGLDIHEAPRVSPKNETKLELNSVITVEPGVYYSEWGGIRLEDMIVVGKEKSVYLNTLDTFLEIE